MIDAERLVAQIRDQIAVLGADYVNALLVALLGRVAAGVSEAEVQRLIRIGMLRQNEVHGLQVAGVDPVAFVQGMGRVTAALEPTSVEASRDWSLDAWRRRVRAAARQPGAAVPEDEETAQGIVRIEPVEAEAPEGLTPRQEDAWRQAVGRAGEFARGLGNTMIDDMGRIVTEVWDGETPAFVPEPERRSTFLEAVREATSEAIARGWSARKLATEIGQRTGDWARDLLRIARTELQGAYNDSVVMQGVRIHGEDARVARIPESGACEICIALLLDTDGRPIVWTVKELMANGTNVGRRASEWMATIWPIHPHCRCGTVVVPDGFMVDEDGGLDWSGI